MQGGAINIRNGSTLDTISNSTLADNVATEGGGAIFISRNSTLARLISTIVAVDKAKSGNDIQGMVGGEPYNLISDNSCSNLIAGQPNSNKSTVGISFGSIDPLLGPLKDNGGPTLTRALKTSSPAINFGANPLNLEFDQRGPKFPRTLNVQTDIGAFEVCNCRGLEHLYHVQY